MASNKIVPYCRVVVGRPMLCFGKSIYSFHLSSVYVVASHETADDMGNILPSESSSGIFSVYKIAIGSNAVINFVKFWIG